MEKVTNVVVIKTDGRMLLGTVEVLIYSFSIKESQALQLQATLSPDINRGGRFQKDSRLSFWRDTDTKKNALYILWWGDNLVGLGMSVG